MYKHKTGKKKINGSINYNYTGIKFEIASSKAICLWNKTAHQIDCDTSALV